MLEEVLQESQEQPDSVSDEGQQDATETTMDMSDGADPVDDLAESKERTQEVTFENKDKVGTQIGVANLSVANLIVKLLQNSQSEIEKPKRAETYELPEWPTDPSGFVEIASSDLGARLGSERLIIIGCADEVLAFTAAHTLIERLGTTDQERRRGYNFKGKFDEEANVGIDSFLPEEKNGSQSVVVVSALSDSGEAFVSSLINDVTAVPRLRQHGVWLICIVNPAYIDENVNGRAFARHYALLKISYLQYLLSLHFPTEHLQLEQQILEQRAAGRWDKDETKFCHEIKNYIDRNNLREEIERRNAPLTDPRSSKTLFRDDQHIEKTVLYVVTYFPDVAIPEFCGLVEALLGGRDVLATIPRFTSDESPTTTWPNEPKTTTLVDIWKDNKDRFIWNERFRETISTKYMVQAIDFSDYSMRASLKEYLEDERSFFLKDQFNILQRKGFFFHPSGRIGASIVSLTAEMAVSYPDEYDNEWLVGIIKSLRDHAQPGESVGNEQEESLCFLPVNRPSWGYFRVSELIRQLMKPQTRDIVNRCLSDLMRLKYYDAVLNLIRRLRFAPDFDRLHWLKQLFDRGDTSIKTQAFNHLYDSVREASVSIYESLSKLESWFPEDDRDVGKYPPSARFALRLLIKYCFETIYRFSQESRGSASTNYILFNFSDQDVAKDSLDQLVRWLLDPAIVNTLHDLESDAGMKNALKSLGLEKKPIRLLGALMAEWAVILGGLAETSLIETTDETRDTQSVSAIDVLELLIERVASSTSNDQQRDLITFWEESNRELLRSMSNSRPPRRDQLAVRWNRVFSLSQQFRKMHLTAKAS